VRTVGMSAEARARPNRAFTPEEVNTNLVMT
jgi:hypothetical protein